MTMSAHPFVILLVLAVAVSAAPNPYGEKKPQKQVCTTDGCKQAAKKILDYMDSSVNPCDNFYKFACGGFIKSTSIPPDKAEITSYTSLYNDLYGKLKIIFEEEPQANEIKPFLKLKQLYKSCMDTKSIENAGLKRVFEILKRLKGWPVLEGNKWNENNFDWQSTTAELHDMGMFYFGFLWFGVDVHPKNGTLGMLVIDQPPLGSQEILSEGISNPVVHAYHKYMTHMAIIFGASKEFAQKEMLDALNFEIELAKISLPAEKLRDTNSQYNPTTLNEMQKKFPSINWVDLANKLNAIEGKVIAGTDEVNVVVPQYITDLETLLRRTPKRVQANYIIWRAIKDIAIYLNEAVLEKRHAFDSARIGLKKRKPRWEECVTIINDELQILSGALYVRKHFSPQARDKATEIVLGVRKAFTQILKDLDWMDAETKHHALEKAENMLTYLGYSNELLDDKKLEEYFDRWHQHSNDFLQLELDSAVFRIEKYSERLWQVVSRLDWRKRPSPTKLFAFYDNSNNIIEFPAGILQPVYFDENRPRYINFASIGFHIGHAITHGFDDQGRRYDKEGNLIDWWNKETNDAFLKRVQCIIEQYGNYSVPEVGHINGVRTQGENIADNGAVKESYLAYQDWVKHHSGEPILPGLDYSSNQLFWISSANTWCANSSPEYIKQLIISKHHSTNEFRVLGSLQNLEQFAEDFECPLGSPMNPIKKCTVW